MNFHGLFIGIDRYSSPAVDWLTCAARDALALHALFADTFGEEKCVLLRDREATRSQIAAEFERLSKVPEDDFVVIGYSGHGTNTHELVTYDADVEDLANTSIPLDTLTEWFQKIPAKQLVCFLDCCFSGEMGAKVLTTGLTPRSLASTDSLLEQLAGQGRLILTASLPNEAAYEERRLRHGLLTYHLLEGLQGAEEVCRDGRVSIYALLDHVSKRVTEAAKGRRKEQHPTFKGKIDQAMSWPVLRPGALYGKAFPQRAVHPPVTGDVAGLQAYGFPPGLLDAWRGSITSLNALQVDAINNFGLLDGNHLVVSAPTSSGKTIIGELAALRGVLDRQRALFLFPLKALVNDKHRYFTRVYGPFGIRTIRATGEMSDDLPALMRGQYDLCLLTYEKFATLVLSNPYLLDQVGTIVVDEAQMIADPERGANLEFILTYLRTRRTTVGSEPQLIALSAVIGDTNGLEGWLGARLLLRTERPVPLDEGILRETGAFRYVESETQSEKTISGYIRREIRKNSSQDLVVPLVRRLVGEGKQVIVFRETRGKARGCANYLAEALGLPPASGALASLPDGDPSLASQVLRRCLQGGVAFHVSDLERDERLAVEEQFRTPDSGLRVIAATTTLAMGVNTPASAVVIAGLMHPGGQPYTVAEYKNIVGRAGRLGMAERGTSFLLAMSEREAHNSWNQYVKGTPENLVSRFLSEGTDSRSLILRSLVAAEKAAGQGMSADEIITFLEGSFGAYQQLRTRPQWKWDRDSLSADIAGLTRHGLIEAGEGGSYSLTALGRLAGQSGITSESMFRIVNALRTIQPEQLNDPTLLGIAQLSTELEQISFPYNRVSTDKEPRTWPSELLGQGVATRIVTALQTLGISGDQSVLRPKRALACLLWMSPLSLEQIEAILTQFGNKFDGAAGPIRSVSTRVCDILPVVAKAAMLIHPSLDLVERVNQILVRLETGASAAAANLAARVGTVLNRGDYQNLVNARLTDLDKLSPADAQALSACLSGGQKEEKIRLILAAVEAHQQDKKREEMAAVPIPLYEPS